MSVPEFDDVEIHAFDDNRDLLLYWMDQMKIYGALPYIDKINVHSDADKRVPASIIDSTYISADRPILYTENAIRRTGFSPNPGPSLGNWTNVEELLKILFENLKKEVTGYLDKNLMLDYQGGPSFISGDFSDASIVINTDYTEFYKQPTYYAMAHFSKFLPPGARLVDSYPFGPNSLNFQSLSFILLDGKVTTVLYNNDETRTIPVTLVDRLRGKIDLYLPPKTIKTVVY